MTHVPVLILGGGPVGLTLGIDLAHRGIPALLVEERTEPTRHPKATLLGARSMELFRRWGLDEAVYAACMPQQDGYFILFTDTLAGQEFLRFTSPAVDRIRARDPATIARFRELQWSPYGKTQIGQQALEPVLLEHARGLSALSMRHGAKLESFVDEGPRVRATLSTGETITADWLVACDGGASMARRQLGIGWIGRGRMRSNVSFLFRSPDFLAAHGKGLANLYFVFTKGSFGVFTAIDGRELWNYQFYWADPTRDDRLDDPRAILHRAMGRPFEAEILATTHWHHHQSVAQSWRAGRVLLAGDAAHLFVPTGGVGMNTGIGDAADLAWKLEATIRGWAGPRLLDSYEAERKPVAWRNSVISPNNSDRIDAVMAEAATGIDATRLTERLRWMARQFNSAGTHLGYRYADSPIVVPDGTPEPPDDPNQVAPSTWPGSRLPHHWLDDGRSTLDLVGTRFTVLGPAPGLAAALRACGAPVAEAAIPPEAATFFTAPCLLVRPDGHVAWRGAAEPVDAAVIAATVTGR
ncbi:MAG: FAD-dependent monooxygenase [Alphaproteobacteria bacterium]|nr:FAD-dependent monooxygenase [Alphaproteobacteria bacterium]